MAQSAYDILDQLHLSVQLLAVIGFVLLFTLVISLRELATWFLKINSIKNELALLNENVAALKLQIARLQNPVYASPAPTVLAPAPSEAPQKETEPSSDQPRRQFPISH